MSNRAITYPLPFDRLISRISLLFLFSALALLSDMAAHNAAGSHPISVSCNTRQRMAVSNLPRNRKERKGQRMARSIQIKTVCLLR